MPRAKVLQNNAEENTELAFFPFGGAVIRVLSFSLLYLIERGGKKLLYGHDSGWSPEISHNSKLLHHEFDEIFKPAGVVVAYDGLIMHI